MSMTRGHLPLLLVCLPLSSVLPAHAQSEGELASAYIRYRAGGDDTDAGGIQPEHPVPRYNRHTGS